MCLSLDVSVDGTQKRTIFLPEKAKRSRSRDFSAIAQSRDLLRQMRNSGDGPAFSVAPCQMYNIEPYRYQYCTANYIDK